jgi:predicted NBD/HSP70 family sugar kinase
MSEVGVGATNGGGPGQFFQHLRDGHPRTRPELIKVTGLARSTVSTRIDALLAAGLIISAGDAASTGGRPPARVVFNKLARVILAVDAGVNHSRIALTDLAGNVLAERRSDLHIAEGPETVLGWIVQAGEELLAETGRHTADLAGVGIALPGPVEYPSGRPANPPLMPGWHGFDVPGWVSAKLQARVLVDNDVNVMALAEHLNSWPLVNDLLLLTVDVGIGAGIVSAGVLQRGAQGAAGQIGHIKLPRAGDLMCVCGNPGCLATVASGRAVLAELSKRGIEVSDPAELAGLIRAGSVDAVHVLRQAGRDIGEVLAGSVNLLNPSVVVLGGATALAGEDMITGVREVVYRRSLPLATAHLRIVQSQMGDNAGIAGAAAIVRQEVLAPESVDALCNGGANS